MLRITSSSKIRNYAYSSGMEKVHTRPLVYETNLINFSSFLRGGGEVKIAKSMVEIRSSVKDTDNDPLNNPPQMIESHVWTKNWQTLSRSPKSEVQVEVDDWVFIKITFSNHPPPPPPGKVSKKQYTAIYPKLKVLVYVRGFWNMIWNRPRAKD